jgi:hypothetical protein
MNRPTQNLLNNFPNTFILGAAKAGTTTLYQILCKHPQVFFSFDKEPMFFSRDDYYRKGMDWYTSAFFNGSNKYPIRGEASPHYLYWSEKVAPRLKKQFSEVELKFIVILRNPIERAYSWYWNMVMEEKEDLPFLEALRAEKTRLEAYRTDLEEFGSMRYGYIRGGCYSSQITKFMENFPRANFHILLLDDLEQNSIREVESLCDFLKIDSHFNYANHSSNLAAKPRLRSLHTFLKKNSKIKELIKPFIPLRVRYNLKRVLIRVNLKPQKYPHMESEARELLIDAFSGEISTLSNILNRNLSFWINK